MILAKLQKYHDPPHKISSPPPINNDRSLVAQNNTVYWYTQAKKLTVSKIPFYRGKNTEVLINGRRDMQNGFLSTVILVSATEVIVSSQNGMECD
jgi:hypothetical protein